MSTYRDIGLAHAAATVNVILAHDAIAVLKTLAALESAESVHSRTEDIGRVVWVEDVDASTGLVLGVSVWGEDLDGIVDA